MLPLDLTIEDYSTNEKIAHLPRKLTEEGSGPFGNERPYDLCYITGASSGMGPAAARHLAAKGISLPRGPPSAFHQSWK
jgi:hypothetical protein